MPRANNYAKHKPTVVLFVPNDDMDRAQALVGDDGKPLVFENFAKASKHVSRFIDPKMFMDIQYVNEKPEIGAGDREETHNKRCLKCNGFLRLSLKQHISQINGVGTLAVDEYECPKCGRGE